MRAPVNSVKRAPADARLASPRNFLRTTPIARSSRRRGARPMKPSSSVPARSAAQSRARDRSRRYRECAILSQAHKRPEHRLALRLRNSGTAIQTVNHCFFLKLAERQRQRGMPAYCCRIQQYTGTVRTGFLDQRRKQGDNVGNSAGSPPTCCAAIRASPMWRRRSTRPHRTPGP